MTLTLKQIPGMAIPIIMIDNPLPKRNIKALELNYPEVDDAVKEKGEDWDNEYDEEDEEDADVISFYEDEDADYDN